MGEWEAHFMFNDISPMKEHEIHEQSIQRIRPLVLLQPPDSGTYLQRGIGYFFIWLWENGEVLCYCPFLFIFCFSLSFLCICRNSLCEVGSFFSFFLFFLMCSLTGVFFFYFFSFSLAVSINPVRWMMGEERKECEDLRMIMD